MKKYSLYSRAHYVILHGVVDSFFSQRPHIDFLRDSHNDFKLFQRYILWSHCSRRWTHVQKTILYNLYWRRSAQNALRVPTQVRGPLACWADLLKYYLYTPMNPVPLDDFLKSHPYLSLPKQNFYAALSTQGFLPSFQEVLIKLSPLYLLSQALLENPPAKPLLFSYKEQVLAHYDLSKEASEVSSLKRSLIESW